jgi:hypothetical protein
VRHVGQHAEPAGELFACWFLRDALCVLLRHLTNRTDDRIRLISLDHMPAVRHDDVLSARRAGRDRAVFLERLRPEPCYGVGAVAKNYQTAPLEYSGLTVGINVDPRNASARPSPAYVRQLGFNGIRLTSTFASSRYANAFANNGLAVLGIITSESQGYIMADSTVVQIGNEPDVPDTFRAPEAYAEDWILYRNTYPDLTMFSAGLASGQLGYCEQFLSSIADRAPLPDAIAIHPYLKTPDEAAGLFDDYWNLTVRLFGAGIPIVATEWYRPAGEEQIWPFQDMLDNAEVGRSTVWNSWFCFSDGMVPGLGLVDGFGNPKPEGYELVSALNGAFLPMQQ